MRVWDIHPGYLNRQSLLGEHRELHGLVSILVNGKKGYSQHPETLRWVGYGWALKQRHRELVAEMNLRGYQDKSPVRTRSNLGVWPSVYIDEPHIQLKLLKAKYENKEKIRKGCIVICTGGTADIPVAEEAAQTAEFFGNHVERLYDVGVAGVHRLLSNMDTLRKGNCVVAVAGMEGALASVVAGLVEKPVIAVPTSVGYGANFGGMSALLTMINSCANGISVVNIDNGYGAGYISSQINRLAIQSNK